jgi:hypothetical protein
MRNNRLGTSNIIEIIPTCFLGCLGCLSCVFSLIIIWVGLALLSSATSSILQDNKIIECHRISPSRADCKIKKETRLFKKNIQTIQDIKDIKRAEVVTSRDGGGYREGARFRYDLTLVSQTPTIYVFESTTSHNPSENLYVSRKAEINDFIKNPNERVLKVETNSTSSSFIAFSVGIVLTIIGMSPWIILAIARRYGSNWFVRQR